MKLYDKTRIDKNSLLFDNKMLFWLILPIVIEQFLNSLIGLVDTMMVSTVGSEAMSAAEIKKKAINPQDRSYLRCL